MTDPRLHGPEFCASRCSVCPDGGHHWLEDGTDPDDPDFDDVQQQSVLEYDRKHGTEHAVAYYACKHCCAWAEAEYVWELMEEE